MFFNELDARSIKEQVDQAQLWSAWIDADRMRRHSFMGTLDWEERNGRRYLYRRKGGTVKSFGLFGPETERARSAFQKGKEENAERLRVLSGEMDRQAAVLRAIGAGRIPVMAARILRTFATQRDRPPARVIGTNALYAFEAMAGVRFDSASTATGDIDFLIDDRNRMKLVTEEQEPIGLMSMIQKQVDRTFKSRGPRDFRLTNDKGYMVEFVRPEPRPIYRKMPGAEPLTEGDVEPAPIFGLQWLVHAPAVDVIVMDERGFPAPMRCPDPRHWAAHKLWLATREDRDPAKSLRDDKQGRLVLNLIRDRLPQFPLDEEFLAKLPGELRVMMSGKPPSGADSTSPDW